MGLAYSPAAAVVVHDVPDDSMWDTPPPNGALAVYAGVLYARSDGAWGTSGAEGVETAETYAGTGSHQLIAADLTLGVAAGSSTPSKFLGAIMGNLLGAALTKAANYLGGVIGFYSVTGTKATTFPAGAVLAGIADGVTEADGAVVAFIDGDSAQTNAGAAFKVRNNNSTPGSGFDYGLDLQDAAHDGFAAVAYRKGEVRLLNDVVVLTLAGVPVDGVSGTGAGFAGPGSQAIDVTNKNIYVNANTKASPTWKLVTRAA